MHFSPAPVIPRSILESGIMSSQRRTESARANGVRSHGPVTESGKQICSQNALRHTLLARCVGVEGESHEGFEETLNDHLDRFQPDDGVEVGIVEEMVAAWWRMRRAWAIETRLLSDCVDDQRPGDEMGRLAAAFNTMADSKALALLHRYETRLNRTYQRGLKNLLLLQTLKVRNEPNPICEHSTAGLASDVPAPDSSAAGLAGGVLSPKQPDPTPGLRPPTPEI